MACEKCPPGPGSEWLECSECTSKYMEYEGLFHSLLCPRCAKIRIQQRALATARRKQLAAVFVTNEVPDGGA